MSIELIEKRTEYIKYFLNDDGTITESIYNTPIHYLNEEGKLEDITLTIVEEKNWEFEYALKTNSFRAYFNDSTSIENFTLAGFEFVCNSNMTHWVNYKLINANPTGFDYHENIFKYYNVFNNVDLEYEVTPIKLKERIIIKQPIDNFSYTFSLKMDEGIRPVNYQDDNTIYFVEDATGMTMWKIDPFYAYDSSGVPLVTHNIEYSIDPLEYEGEVYESINLYINDPEFLANAVYPIIIDPTTTIQPNATTGYDTYISNSTTTTNYANATNLIVAQGGVIEGGGAVDKAFIKFDISSIPAFVSISSALMTLNYSSIAGSSIPNCNNLNSNWDVTSLTYSNNSTTLGSYNPNSASSLNSSHIFELKSMMTAWTNGQIPNYGCILQYKTGMQNDASVWYYSSEYATATLRPKLDVTYTLSAITKSWEYPLTNTLHGLSLDSMGNTYAGGVDNLVTKISSTGSLIWPYNLGANNLCSALDYDNNLYVGDTTGSITKLTSGGTLVWKFSTGINSVYSIAVDTAGNIFAGSGFSSVKKFDANKNLIWQCMSPSGAVYSLAISNDGYIYAGDGNNTISKISSATGTVVWTYNSPALKTYALVTDPYGYFYSGDNGFNVTKFSPQGNILWQYACANSVYGLALDPSGNIFAGDDSGNLYKLSFDGKLLLKCTLAGGIDEIYTDNKGYVYVSDESYKVTKLLDTSYSASGVNFTNLSFENNSYTNQSNINFTGKVTDYSGTASITIFKINDTNVSFDGTGNFTYPVSLSEGLNTLMLYGEDSVGNYKSYTINITLDIVSPILTSTNTISGSSCIINFNSNETVKDINLYYRIKNGSWNNILVAHSMSYTINYLNFNTNYEYYFTTSDLANNMFTSSIYEFSIGLKIYDTYRGNTGMTLYGSGYDDNTLVMSDIGFDFYYNGVNCRTTINVSGNSWVGFGSATEHLDIDRRDAKCNNLYYSKETIRGMSAFRIRWEGSKSYASQTNDLWWELILFSDSTMELISQIMPTTIDGINTFNTMGNGTYTQTGGWTSGKSWVFTPTVAQGKSYTVAEGCYPPMLPPSTPSITYPIEGNTVYSSPTNITWNASTDPNGLSLTYDIDISNNMGLVWTNIINGATGTSCNYDFSNQLAGSDNTLRIRACNGYNYSDYNQLSGLFTISSYKQLIFQPDASTGKDTYSDSGYPDNNYGQSDSIYIHTDTNATTQITTFKKGYIKFDLSSVPSSCIINSCIITLSRINDFFVGKNLTIQQIISDWDENSLTDKTSPSVTTITSIDTSATSQTQIDVTSLAQGWINNPSSNNGICLLFTKGASGSSYDISYYSSNYINDPTLRPKITLIYYENTNSRPTLTAQQVGSVIHLSWT